jgi:hypothetical protein
VVDRVRGRVANTRTPPLREVRLGAALAPPPPRADTWGDMFPQVNPPFSWDSILSLVGVACWALRQSVPGQCGLGCTPSPHVALPGTMGPLWPIKEPSRNPLMRHNKIPELFTNPERDIPYMNLIPRTILNLLVMPWVQSKTTNHIRSPTHIPVFTLSIN